MDTNLTQQQQIEEIARNQARIIAYCLCEEAESNPTYEDDVLTMIPHITQALTEATQPLLERVRELEEELKQALAATCGESIDILQESIKLRQSNESLLAQVKEIEAKTSLEGYRAMGAQIATALDERDAAYIQLKELKEKYEKL